MTTFQKLQTKIAQNIQQKGQRHWSPIQTDIHFHRYKSQLTATEITQLKAMCLPTPPKHSVGNEQIALTLLADNQPKFKKDFLKAGIKEGSFRKLIQRLIRGGKVEKHGQDGSNRGMYYILSQKDD